MSALHVGKTSVPKSNLSLLLMLSMLLGKLSDSDRLIKMIFFYSGSASCLFLKVLEIGR